MNSPTESPQKSPLHSDSELSLDLPQVRSPEKTFAANLSQQERPSRRSSPSLSAIFASTSSSRNTSPRAPSRGLGTPPALQVPGPAFSPGRRSNVSTPQAETANPYRELVIRSYIPHIAVLASAETEELLAQKGFVGGFLELIRPYGENIQGRVTIRDSTGLSKSWDNFAVRFTKLKDGLENARAPERPNSDTRSQTVNGYLNKYLPNASVRLRTGGDIPYIEDLVERHLSYYENNSEHTNEDYFNRKKQNHHDSPLASPFHLLYLRRLLSGLPLSPHETFSHPVACIIAISSRNLDPIDELRQLYAATSTGDYRLPQWVNNDFLRYYVLIHDEDHDDIQKSTHLFEQMKRHFGLHCHLLRLRSIHCVASDDDCSKLPVCEWISASEELAEIDKRESFEAIDDPTPCLFDSDISAIQTFVREMVSQSVIPMMERLATTWNDQIASRRRGISGRFLSLSKKWTPFGSGSRNGSSASPNASNSSGNYDSMQGFYRPDSPEAIIRKLADYAFMLRDFKLAQSTYEILKQDYNNDKAWKYYAGVAEMSVISTLISQPLQSLTAKGRAEGIDQLLETAVYSYITRCTAPYYALRTLMVTIELLRSRGGSAIEDAARWAFRIIEIDLVGPVGHALLAERIAALYASRAGVGSLRWGSRRRKAGIWSVLAVEAWLKLEKFSLAQRCLAETVRLYKDMRKDASAPLAFEGMSTFIQHLGEALVSGKLADGRVDALAEAVAEVTVQDESAVKADRGDGDSGEKKNIAVRRKSLLDADPGDFGAVPLTPTRKGHEALDDNFQ